jgi:hypothetical protein
MWVYREDPREVGFEEKPGCGDFPTAMTRRKVEGELWVGVAPSGRSPVIWIPMKGILRAVKPRVEGLISNDIKSDEI